MKIEIGIEPNLGEGFRDIKAAQPFAKAESFWENHYKLLIRPQNRKIVREGFKEVSTG